MILIKINNKKPTLTVSTGDIVVEHFQTSCRQN